MTRMMRPGFSKGLFFFLSVHEKHLNEHGIQFGIHSHLVFTKKYCKNQYPLFVFQPILEHSNEKVKILPAFLCFYWRLEICKFVKLFKRENHETSKGYKFSENSFVLVLPDIVRILSLVLRYQTKRFQDRSSYICIIQFCIPVYCIIRLY